MIKVKFRKEVSRPIELGDFGSLPQAWLKDQGLQTLFNIANQVPVPGQVCIWLEQYLDHAQKKLVYTYVYSFHDLNIQDALMFKMVWSGR